MTQSKLNKMKSAFGLSLNQTTQTVLRLILILLVFATLLRVAFIGWFKPQDMAWLDSNWLSVLWFGLRFDARWAVGSVLFVWLISILPWVRHLLHKRPATLRRYWFWCWFVIVQLWITFYIVDFGHYAYLKERLSPVVVSLAKDWHEALGFVWQGYPVIWLAVLWGIVSWFCLYLFERVVPTNNTQDTKKNTRYLCTTRRKGQDQGGGSARSETVLEYGESSEHPPTQRLPVAASCAKVSAKSWGFDVLFFVVFIFLMHGRFSQYPFRWSEMSYLPAFMQSAATTPAQALKDTWDFRTIETDQDALKRNTAALRQYVHTSNSEMPPLDSNNMHLLLRNEKMMDYDAKLWKQKPTQPLNVVFVVMESFAAHKTGVMGHPLKPTPYFDAMANDGVLFTRMMTAHMHTARGVFAIITGIPDVSEIDGGSSASRNPKATNQQLVINELNGYDKFYMLSGSTSWANIRGLLTSSIPGIQIFEEQNWKSPRHNVWGISDKNLFFEANDILKAQKKPFFAVIQTSGNHSPHTIPDEDISPKGGFELKHESDETLKKMGFFSDKEYNAYRYLDWCVGQFINKAKQEAYFDNTLFVFIGDHGNPGHVAEHMPKAFETLELVRGHTPFLIYSPKWLKTYRDNQWAQQVDVMPTVGALLGVPYRNTTLGRNLFSKDLQPRLAYTFRFAGWRSHGLLVGDHYLLFKEPDTAKAAYSMDEIKRNLSIVSLDKPTQNQYSFGNTSQDKKITGLADQWGDFIWGYRNAALYLQTNNHKMMPASGANITTNQK